MPSTTVGSPLSALGFSWRVSCPRVGLEATWFTRPCLPCVTYATIPPLFSRMFRRGVETRLPSESLEFWWGPGGISSGGRRLIIMLACIRSHCTVQVSVAYVEGGCGTLCNYDSKNESGPSQTQHSTGYTRGWKTVSQLLPQASQQDGDNDCCIAVLVQVFHALAGVPVALSTHCLLWRRLLAAFLHHPDLHFHFGDSIGRIDPILFELSSTHNKTIM